VVWLDGASSLLLQAVSNIVLAISRLKTEDFISLSTGALVSVLNGFTAFIIVIRTVW